MGGVRTRCLCSGDRRWDNQACGMLRSNIDRRLPSRLEDGTWDHGNCPLSRSFRADQQRLFLLLANRQFIRR